MRDKRALLVSYLQTRAQVYGQPLFWATHQLPNPVLAGDAAVRGCVR